MYEIEERIVEAEGEFFRRYYNAYKGNVVLVSNTTYYGASQAVRKDSTDGDDIIKNVFGVVSTVSEWVDLTTGV